MSISRSKQMNDKLIMNGDYKFVSGVFQSDRVVHAELSTQMTRFEFVMIVVDENDQELPPLRGSFFLFFISIEFQVDARSGH